MGRKKITVDGNEAAALVAYRLSELFPYILLHHHHQWENLVMIGQQKKLQIFGKSTNCN
jgi:hypothetical protein